MLFNLCVMPSTAQLFAFLFYVICCVLMTVVGVCPPADKLEPCKCHVFGSGDKKEGTLWFDCIELNLGDEKISQVLDAFISTPGVSPLRELYLYKNNLTRIPDQVRHFTELDHVFLESNEIKTIEKGSLNFTRTLGLFTLNNNKIITIEPGAFSDINYGEGSYIILDGNNLTRFDEDVFLPILEAMEFQSTGNSNTGLELDRNPFDCESDHCHLAWLIRDNQHLIQFIRNGKCSNGKTFEQLESNSYNNCQKQKATVDRIRKKNSCPSGKSISPCKCCSNGEIGGLELDCTDRFLGDVKISQILNIFLQDEDRLGKILLRNTSLSKVPEEIGQFTRLAFVDLQSNKIRSIKSGAFKFPDRVEEPGSLDLGYNNISVIEDGAFQGQFLHLSVHDNHLSRFDSNVFRPVLEKMLNDPRRHHIYIGSNPMPCSADVCHLKWLLGDSRGRTHFLNLTVEGRCSRGTRFEDLDQNAFSHCEPPNDKSWVMWIVVSVVIVLLLALLVVISFKYQKKRKAFHGIKALLAGNVERFNPEMPLDQQTELLPYDKTNWEIPRQNIKLGIQLGVGQFGRVVKAEVSGMKGHDTKTVAVKMVRSQANVSAIEALVSEMKIMSFLGSHLNVVNLIGACTKGISKGNLLVVVEYCRHGNLQSYLKNNQDRYLDRYVVNQIDSVDFFVPGADATINERSYADTADSPTKDADSDYLVPSVSGAVHDLALHSSSTTNDSGDGYLVPISVSVDQLSTVRYENVSGQLTQISTRDLIFWSFQIAKGMDYLASKKIMHGDLAARNVLLADDGIVKVADFGLARQLYHYDYKKQGQDKLPIKWMAPESLTEMVFSSQSDVWSFGIVMWELFSLGKVPYPGIAMNEEFIQRLQNGYRMSKPVYAPNEIGNLMADCWKTEPTQRPTFRQLAEALITQLESSVVDHYAKLSEPFESSSSNNCASLQYLRVMTGYQ